MNTSELNTKALFGLVTILFLGLPFHLFSKAPIDIPTQFQQCTEIADSLVKASLGKQFCKQYVVLDTQNIKVNVRKAFFPPRHLSGQIISKVKESNWHSVDFPFYITLAEAPREEWQSRNHAIVIRIAKSGEVLFDEIRGNDFRFATYGLAEKAMIEFKPLTDVVPMALAAGISEIDIEKNPPRLNWVPSKERPGYGQYGYAFLHDRKEVKGYGYRLEYHRKWTFSLENGALIDEGEHRDGEGADLDIVRISQDGKFGFSSFGKVILEPIYESLPRKMDFPMIAKKDGQWGLIDKKGNPLIPFQYDKLAFLETDLGRYRRQYVVATLDSQLGLFDARGNELRPVRYSIISYDESEKIILLDEEGNLDEVSLKP